MKSVSGPFPMNLFSSPEQTYVGPGSCTNVGVEAARIFGLVNVFPAPRALSSESLLEVRRFVRTSVKPGRARTTIVKLKL